MSSVLIRGIEIPTTCRECIIGNPKAKTCIIGKPKMNTKRRDDCPLVEIPTPHGRLIDIKSVEDGKFVTVSNDYQRWWNGALESVIDNAATVIEAEGETDA